MRDAGRERADRFHPGRVPELLLEHRALRLGLFQSVRGAPGLGDVLDGADDLFDLPRLDVGLPRRAHIPNLFRPLMDDAVLGVVEGAVTGGGPGVAHPRSVIGVDRGQERLFRGLDLAGIVAEHAIQLFRPVHALIPARPHEPAEVRDALDLPEQRVARAPGDAEGRRTHGRVCRFAQRSPFACRDLSGSRLAQEGLGAPVTRAGGTA